MSAEMVFPYEMSRPSEVGGGGVFQCVVVSGLELCFYVECVVFCDDCQCLSCFYVFSVAHHELSYVSFCWCGYGLLVVGEGAFQVVV